MGPLDHARFCQRLGAPAGGALAGASRSELLAWLEDAARAAGFGWFHLHPGSGLGLAALDNLLGVARRWTDPPLLVVEDGAGPSLRLQVEARPELFLLRELGVGGPAVLIGDPGRLACLQAAPIPGPGSFAEDPAEKELASWTPQVGRRLLVLDVDGVLIDPGRSFLDAVALALAELAPDLEWSDAHFRAFKRAGGFNNDFRLAAGALALHESGRMGTLWEAAGKGIPGLEPRLDALEPRCKEVVQRYYARTLAQERPTVSLAELRATGLELAVLTGRPPEEWELAKAVLGFELPAITDSAPHLRKPRPEGLIQLADAFGAEEILFAGDTLDDAACLLAARALLPGLRWHFIAIGPDRERIAAPGDLQGERLRDVLARL